MSDSDQSLSNPRKLLTLENVYYLSRMFVVCVHTVDYAQPPNTNLCILGKHSVIKSQATLCNTKY